MRFWRVRFRGSNASGVGAALVLRKAAPRLSLFVIMLIGLGDARLSAQDTNQIEQLKKQLQDMQNNFERVQREQRQQIEALSRKLEELTKQQAAEAEKKKLEEELTAQLTSNQPPATAQAPTTAAAAAWSPTAPLTIARAVSHT